MAVISKLAANDFKYYYFFIHFFPPLEKLITVYPFLDVGRNFSFLSDWSWHARWNQQSFPQYAVFNFIIFCIVIFDKKRIQDFLQKVVDWVNTNENTFPRRVIFTTVILVVSTFLLKLPMGFWFPGIGGWTYANWESKLLTERPELLDGGEKVEPDSFPFLRQAYISDHAQYLSESGFIKGKAIFLHFRGGKVLPGNYELTEMVFPEYVFGREMERIHMRQRFLQIVKASLEYRRLGRRFLLPESIAYPNHISYMNIDYRQYPPAQHLEKISFWDMVIFIDEENQVKPVQANKLLEIHDKSHI